MLHKAPLETLDSRKIGVCPTGLHVLRTEGIRRKPDSSIKTRWAASLAAFFYTRPDGSFPFRDDRFVALNCPTFRLLMAPTYLVEEFAYVIRMVLHLQLTFDQIGDPLCCPQLRPVTMGHGPFGQKANEAFFLFRGQSRWSARRWFGFQRIFTAPLERIAPTKDATRVTTHAPGDLMKGQLLFKESNYAPPSIFQRLWRTMRSHRDTPF